MDARQFLHISNFGHDALTASVEAGWLKPERGAAGWRFSTKDLARAQLIRELTGDFGIDRAGISAVLSLIDEIKALQQMLETLMVVYKSLPAPLLERVQREIFDRPMVDEGFSASLRKARPITSRRPSLRAGSSATR